ncbi:MAG: DUF305 domain-containing protein [Pseudonocardiaceae bacterium]
MRIHSVAGVLVAAATAGGLLAGCGSKPTPSPASTPPPPAASSAAPNPQQQHNQADVVFLQNMIPHHARAIAMSQTAGNQATSPQVKDLVTRIETEQSPQAQQMSDLLTAWGTPTPATASVGTAGSLGQGQTAVTTSGATFDRMFLHVMIVHHQDAITMSQTELAQGNNPATRNLAQQIISAQQAEISEMQALLQVI